MRGTAEPGTVQRRGVIGATALLAEALTRQDAPAAAALYAENGRIVTSVDQIVGRDQIQAYWQAGMTLGLSRAALTATDVRLGDGVAVETGRYELVVLGPAGRPPDVDRGRYLALHQRHDDGSWQRVVDLFDPDPATTPGPDLLEGP